MSKVKSQKKKDLKELPKIETINFLLNYSKSLNMIKVGKITFEFNSN